MLDIAYEPLDLLRCPVVLRLQAAKGITQERPTIIIFYGDLVDYYVGR